LDRIARESQIVVQRRDRPRSQEIHHPYRKLIRQKIRIRDQQQRPWSRRFLQKRLRLLFRRFRFRVFFRVFLGVLALSFLRRTSFRKRSRKLPAHDSGQNLLLAARIQLPPHFLRSHLTENRRENLPAAFRSRHQRRQLQLRSFPQSKTSRFRKKHLIQLRGRRRLLIEAVHRQTNRIPHRLPAP